MATYLLINIFMLVMVLIPFRKHIQRPSWNWLLALAFLLVLTAIFDSILVSYDIVSYNFDKILGIMIGSAPIEDFFYPLASMIILPVIWKKLEKND